MNMKLPEDIFNQIKRDFNQSSGEALRKIQTNLKGNLNESLRVVRCIIFLSKGQLNALDKLIETANTDYRDVIFLAEYIDHEKKVPLRVRNFNNQFGKHGLIDRSENKNLS